MYCQVVQEILRSIPFLWVGFDLALALETYADSPLCKSHILMGYHTYLNLLVVIVLAGYVRRHKKVMISVAGISFLVG